jgi:hypothetical protein
VHADALSYDYQQTDMFILNDVLHYLQPEEQKLLLKKCIDHLSPTGSIVLRDGIIELAGRHKGTWLSELFSTKLLGFNKTSGKGLNFISGSLVQSIAGEAGLKITEIDNTRYTSNVIFVLQK